MGSYFMFYSWNDFLKKILSHTKSKSKRIVPVFSLWLNYHPMNGCYISCKFRYLNRLHLKPQNAPAPFTLHGIVRCLWFKTQTWCLSRLIISCAMDVPDSQRGNPQWTGLKKCQVKFPQHCGCWHVCMAAFRFRWPSSGSANLRPALRRVRNGVWPCGGQNEKKNLFPCRADWTFPGVL